MPDPIQGPWTDRDVATGGGGPHDGDMEARVAKLEAAAEYIQRDVSELRTATSRVQDDVGILRSDVSVVKERLTHMPTTLAMWGAVATVFAAFAGVVWWIVQQYLGPLLAKVAGG